MSGTCPALRDLLTRDLEKLGRMGWLDQQCRPRSRPAARASRPRTRTTGGSANPSGCAAAASACSTRSGTGASSRPSGSTRRPSRSAPTSCCSRSPPRPRSTTPPTPSCSGIHLGKRHDRIFPSLLAAVKAGLVRDPHTLPRRPGRDPNHAPLTQAEIARLERIKEDRDRVAAKLGIESTLIANRSPALADRPRAATASTRSSCPGRPTCCGTSPRSAGG